MKPYCKSYVELTSACNLRCSFCPGTSRPARMLTESEFRRILSEITPYTDYVYFHLMGEPLLHPRLPLFLQLAAEAGLKTCLTTNGTLLSQQADSLLSANGLHKLSISLQAKEANSADLLPEDYPEACFRFGKAFEGKAILVYRLWNAGGAETENPGIIALMKQYFPDPWISRFDGYRIGNRVFLEYGKTFAWPDFAAADTAPADGRYFCYALRDQFGILSDGTVVPCCLDHDGELSLGNVFSDSLANILASPRAEAIYRGFSDGRAAEPLCRRCGYAARFQTNHRYIPGVDFPLFTGRDCPPKEAAP